MMERRYNYHKGNADKEFELESYRKCVQEKRELDKFLETIITPYIENKSLKILDAPCGIGHISYFLNDISPSSSFFGIDQTPWMIEEAKKLCHEKQNITFQVGDLYDVLPDYKKTFDITINWRTLSWIPYYDEMLKLLFHDTKKHIFLSSLFYDGDIDFETKVREYRKEVGKKQFNYYCNVYSFTHFKEFAYSLGAKDVKSYNFHINKDIPKPPIDQFSSYTLKLENGDRLQLSGTIILPWKVIQIDL